MRHTVAALAVSALIGCGGGGDGDTYTVEKPTPQPTAVAQLPTTMTCAHNGDMWFCNDQHSCIRDQSVSEQVAYVTDAGETQVVSTDTPTGEPVIKPIRLWAFKFVAGNITIIAECGSNVTFNTSESSTTMEAPSGTV